MMQLIILDEIEGHLDSLEWARGNPKAMWRWAQITMRHMVRLIAENHELREKIRNAQPLCPVSCAHGPYSVCPEAEWPVELRRIVEEKPDAEQMIDHAVSPTWHAEPPDGTYSSMPKVQCPNCGWWQYVRAIPGIRYYHLCGSCGHQSWLKPEL